jgi:hypothetical protein
MIALCSKCKFADTIGYFTFKDEVLCSKCYKWELWREQNKKETRKNIGIYYLTACKPEDFYLKTSK